MAGDRDLFGQIPHFLGVVPHGELPQHFRSADCFVLPSLTEGHPKALIEAMRELLQRWQERGEWLRVQCLELLFVRGWQNKDVARKLNTSEQAVANYKFDFIARMGSTIRKQGLNPDVFPELYS